MTESRALHRTWRIAAIVALGVIATAIAVNFSAPFAMDFTSYWAAAKMTVSGDPAGAYVIARHHLVEASAVAKMTMMPFPYPPPFLFFLAPFGLLGFPLAAAIWVVLTFAAYLLSVWRLMPGAKAVAIAFPPVMLCGVIGQNAFLTTALLIAAVSLIERRPWLAGAAIAGLAIKPQLGVLIPLALLAGREWRVIVAATLGVTLLGVLSIASFGLDAWRGFFHLMPLYATIAAEGLVGYDKMASIFGAAKLLGAPDAVAWGAHAAAALPGAILVWRSWRSSLDPLVRAATLAVGTALVSPYFYVYDQLILIVALAWLWREGARQQLMAAMCLLPLAAILQTAAGVAWFNPAPLLPLVLLVLVWSEIGRKAAKSGSTKRRPAATENSVALV